MEKRHGEYGTAGEPVWQSRTGSVRREVVTPGSSQITHLLEDTQSPPNLGSGTLYHSRVRGEP